MNHQQTQRGLNEEVVVSVKALKLAILLAQRAVATDANRVMLMLYLSIGQFVSQKSRNGVWGTGTIDSISEQLQREMPGLRGFSARNIRNMRFSLNKGGTMIRTMNGNYSIAQFDSMCVSDTLPNDFSKWEVLWLKDDETGAKITLYIYMKESGKNESSYKVEKISNDSVKIIKRVIIE